MPVLPLVGSMIVPPGASRPSRSAASIIARQMRSFTLPAGFKFSSFIHTSAPTPSSCGRRERRTTGVAPSGRLGRAVAWMGLRRRAAGPHIYPVGVGSIERVTVIFPGALGDFLLALPALRGLRARHAGAPLTLVVAGHVLALARLAQVADGVASLDAASAAWLFGGETLPPWLDGQPVVYSWLGVGDAALRARLGRRAAALHCFAVERGPGRLHAAAAYA